MVIMSVIIIRSAYSILVSVYNDQNHNSINEAFFIKQQLVL